MDEKLYFQTVKLQLEQPDGKVVERDFIGLSPFTKEQFEKMKEEGKNPFPAESDKPIISFSEPYPADELIVEDEELNDLVEQVRKVAREQYHDELKEEPPEDQNQQSDE